MQSGWHTAPIQGRGGTRCPFQAAVAVGKEQHRVAMHRPEAAQPIQRDRRQRDETILVALRIADRHPLARGIDVADLKTQALAEAQAKTVGGEIEDPVTEGTGLQEQPLGLLDGEDIGPALGLRRLDPIPVHPGLVPHMAVEKLQAVQVELDRAPGMAVQSVGELLSQRLLGQLVDRMVEIGPDAADRPCVGLDGLGLQSLELEVLEMSFIMALESLLG